MSTVIVYVHGLWLPGHESFLLRRRLARSLDAEVVSFAYSSMRATVTTHATALARRLGAIRADTLHLVAHSLGGLVILKLFEQGIERGLELPPGRIVFLGSPVQGSQSARRLALLPLGRRLLGLTAGEVLLTSHERRWDGSRDLGIIAGDIALGIGRLLGPMRGRNDGTVLVKETVLPGAAEHLLMKVSHSAMPFSAAVARQTAAFLREGRFQPRSP